MKPAWWVAHLLGRSRFTCWTELVTWAMDWHEPPSRRDRRLFTGAVFSGRRCREDVRSGEHPACYCCKFRTPAVHEAMGYPDGPSWAVVHPETPADELDRLLAVTARRVALIRRWGTVAGFLLVALVLVLTW